AHKPELLLLDEPTSALAQREAEAMAEVFLDVKDRLGATLVVIEHDVPLVSSISDELVCMDLGSVIARGSPQAVLEDPRVIAAYLGTDEATMRRSGTMAPVKSRKRRSRQLVAAGRAPERG